MCRNVEALRLFFLADAQAALEARFHDEADDHVEHANEHDRDQDAQDLAAQKRGIAGVDEAAEIGPGELGYAEDAGADAADDAADCVATECIKRVVVTDLGLAEGTSVF